MRKVCNSTALIFTIKSTFLKKIVVCSTLLMFLSCTSQNAERKDGNLSEILDEVWKTEQTPIRKRDSLMQLYGVDSKGAQAQQKVYKKNHATNEKIIIKLLDNNGWPALAEVGESGMLTICNVIQHSDAEIRKKYLPMMKKAVKEKQLAPSLLARTEDRLATDDHKLQVYGTQIKYYPETKTLDVWPIHDPENVDKRRAEIGLGPISEFLKSRRFSLEWNVTKQVQRTRDFKAKTQNEKDMYPGTTWESHKNPAAVGWSKKGSANFSTYLKDSTNISGLVLIHKGQIVFDYGNLKENSYIASCRKSILAILYGKYVDNGSIDLHKTLEKLQIEDVSALLPIEKKATIKDLISARSGVYLNGSNGGDFRRFAPTRGSVQPGSHWLYSNWDFNLAGYVFEQEAKTDIYKEVENQLAIPLGMQDWDMSLQKKSGNKDVSKFQAYHMWFSTRDMARIGLLMLRNGRWKNKQVIPTWWTKEIVKQRTSYAEAQESVPLLASDGLDLGYGYMWWLIENTNDYRFKNAYSAQGAMGQSITVYPEIDVVLAFKTKSDPGRKNTIQTQMNVIKKAVEIYQPE